MQLHPRLGGDGDNHRWPFPSKRGGAGTAEWFSATAADRLLPVAVTEDWQAC